jgi:hypothetical protein
VSLQFVQPRRWGGMFSEMFNPADGPANSSERFSHKTTHNRSLKVAAQGLDIMAHPLYIQPQNCMVSQPRGPQS